MPPPWLLALDPVDRSGVPERSRPRGRSPTALFSPGAPDQALDALSSQDSESTRDEPYPVRGSSRSSLLMRKCGCERRRKLGQITEHDPALLEGAQDGESLARDIADRSGRAVVDG